MSNARDIETFPAADALMIVDWVREGLFADLDAAIEAYQTYGALGCIFNGDVGVIEKPYVPDPTPEWGHNAGRAWQGGYVPPMARR